jgi:hypothetical protein
MGTATLLNIVILDKEEFARSAMILGYRQREEHSNSISFMPFTAFRGERLETR